MKYEVSVADYVWAATILAAACKLRGDHDMSWHAVLLPVYLLWSLQILNPLGECLGRRLGEWMGRKIGGRAVNARYNQNQKDCR